MFFISYYDQKKQEEENKKRADEDRLNNVQRYYPVPPVLSTEYEYQNVNKDPKLRYQVTLYFQEKLIHWIKDDKDFKKFKSKLSFIKSTNGKYHIYDLLRHFVKRTQINWYDLRTNSYLVKEYFEKKL